jgi:hypothetical protein
MCSNNIHYVSYVTTEDFDFYSSLTLVDPLIESDNIFVSIKSGNLDQIIGIVCSPFKYLSSLLLVLIVDLIAIVLRTNLASDSCGS